MKNPFETIPDDRGKREKMPCMACGGEGTVTTKDGKTKNCQVCRGSGKAS